MSSREESSPSLPKNWNENRKKINNCNCFQWVLYRKEMKENEEKKNQIVDEIKETFHEMADGRTC